MPRPCKKRLVCANPKWLRFMPESVEAAQLPPVEMTLEEFEVIRLMDHEGLTQDKSAAQMGVARTTVQAIYSSARHKLATCLVEGRILLIAGGNYTLCKMSDGCRCSHCCGIPEKITKKEEKIDMRIAVTYENGQIFQHFGHSEKFKIYDIEDGKVASSQVADTNGNGHGALAGFLKANQVDVLLCGGIGAGAQGALEEAGIKLYGGASGNADCAVEAFLKNELSYDPNIKCSHHEEHHGAHCAEHSCSGNSCGN